MLTEPTKQANQSGSSCSKTILDFMPELSVFVQIAATPHQGVILRKHDKQFKLTPGG